MKSSILSIKMTLVRDCDSLTSAVIEDGVTIIGNDAFLSCISLESIDIPDSVSFIARCAFFELFTPMGFSSWEGSQYNSIMI